jgi:hypothetical protein
LLVCPRYELSNLLGRRWTIIAAMNYAGIVNYHLDELFDDPGEGQIAAVNREHWLHIFRSLPPSLPPSQRRGSPAMRVRAVPPSQLSLHCR